VHETHPEAALPWYRFFWPWFIVVLLAASVGAAIATVVIAFRNQDSLVDDRYYESGKAINQRLAAEANAERLGLNATFTIDELTGEIHLELGGDLPATPEHLRLELSHATQAARDASVLLAKTGADRFYGQLDAPAAGRYYASLQSEAANGEAPDGAAGAWRLQREIRLPSREPLRLGTSP